MDTELFIKLVNTVASLAIILVTYFLIPWLRQKIDTNKYNYLIDNIEKVVRAAKQIFSDDPRDNELKKKYCVKYITNLINKINIEMTEEEVSILIEGVYEKIKAETAKTE